MLTKSNRVLTASVVLALMTFSATAAPLSSKQKVTVGEFAVKITRALGYAVDDPEEASRTLRMAGVHIDADLSVPLTEGRAADMMREMGMDTVISGDPNSPMSSMAAERAATSVALAASAAPEGFRSTEVTGACTDVGDRMTCYNCCSSILMPRARYPIVVVILCGLLCAKIYPPPSPSSPTP